MWCRGGEQQLKPLAKDSDKIDEQKEETFTRCNRSKAVAHNKTDEAKVNSDDSSSKLNHEPLEGRTRSPDNGGHYFLKLTETSHAMGLNLGSFGSVTKGKDRRRTLASKLFEERLNASRGEGMDWLWEAYANHSIKVRAKSNTMKAKKNKKHAYEDHEEVDEEGNDRQLCCLQAFKFSAGR